MGQLRPEDRPDEKMLRYGVEALSDSELLAVILRTGRKNCSCVELAEELLRPEGDTSGLEVLARKDLQSLRAINGIGTVKAWQIKAVCALASRMAVRQAKQKIRFQHPSTVADYFMEKLRYLEQETVYGLMLNGKNELIHEVMISKGTVNMSLVTPREVLLLALQCRAVFVILLHNHPSGDPSPSEDDIKITQRIREAGELVGIRLMDHIILGENTYYSLREEGFLR